MKERQFLKKTNKIKLYGESDGRSFGRTFSILKKISEGSSVICYEASHENSGYGVLKEFYPQGTYVLERSKTGELTPSLQFEAEYLQFLKERNEYLEPYQMMLAAKQDPAHQDLATFIPPFEIYYGSDDPQIDGGTVYIWTPDPKLETFDKICADIHKNPRKDPERKLVTVLSAIDSLAKCICSLHCADMIHRDIKPSNFGFIKRGNDTLTQTLSLFDINSIVSVYGKTDLAMGTQGFIEPEADYEIANNQTDIYSIGATLFYAIIVTEEQKKNNYLYSPSLCGNIKELVNTSELILASEANAHPRLRNILATILEKCLCPRAGRYSGCEELVKDLDAALYYALPSEMAQKTKSGEKWVLTDIESINENAGKDSSLTMQYHLFKNPLYRCVPQNETEINVVVVGFGNYGQKFLDACLQAGQINGKTLNVTVLSDDITDKDIYLSERPELINFFNIDGALSGSDHYGNIAFKQIKLDRNDAKKNRELLEDAILAGYENKQLHYIFIALGDDKLNASAALCCKTVSDVAEAPCCINYVSESGKVMRGKKLIFPVLVNQSAQGADVYADIERMAFNTHLVWEKNLNIDIRDTRNEFKKKYNHDSCISGVLSLKYKLYSMGIDLDRVSNTQAARAFRKNLADKKNRGLKNELIWIEHRRWVTEKICQGWRAITDLEECAYGATKDEKKKRHVCIVKSRPDQKLATEFKTNGVDLKWDTATDAQIGELDALDQMSVRLHRMYRSRADKINAQNLLYGPSMTAIRNQIGNNRKASVAFGEWFSCLKDIRNGEIGKAALYKGLKKAFLAAVEDLPYEKKTSVNEQIKAFEIEFYPLIAACEYKNWKQLDVSMIDNIPFILTYTDAAYMVIPYMTGNNNDIFKNVAAATVVNPKGLVYLCLIENEQDMTDIKNSIPYVTEYMTKRKFQAIAEMVLIFDAKIGSNAMESFGEEIVRLGRGKIRQPAKRIGYENLEQIPALLSAYLKERSDGKDLFAIEKNESSLSYMLQVSGLYDNFANYRFDCENIRFFDSEHCETFGYIKKNVYISVSDMAAFRMSSGDSSNQPEFFADYKDLWKKYREHGVSSAWKALCDMLNKNANENDMIATFRKCSPSDKSESSNKITYILPFACAASVTKIVNDLIKYEIAEPGSRISGYTSDSCEVVIYDRCDYASEYNKLFSNVYALMFPDAIETFMNTKSGKFWVRFDNLIVTNVKLTGYKSEEAKALLYYFSDINYIVNLQQLDDGGYCFTYATRKIKELMTTAGKILEIYIYHKVKELGQFDDVVSGYEIKWEQTPVKNEFDCIITKGFKTLFVECKARADIEQDFYYKLSKLSEQFGINATAVLIADTQEQSLNDDIALNVMQRQRGNMMNVITIWKSNDINNIGHTLVKVIKGEYESEVE